MSETHVHRELRAGPGPWWDACSACVERNQRLEKLEAVAQGALETLGPCGTDQPRVKVWCIRHHQRRCDVNELRQQFAALAQEEERK